MQGDIRDFPVRLTGQLQGNKILLLDNRVLQSRVGYEVLAPLQTDFGDVLVNFGWLPAPATRDALPQVVLPQGRFNDAGYIAVPSLNPLVEETLETAESFPVVVQQLDLVRIGNLLETGLLDFVVRLQADQQSPFVRQWPSVVMPPHKHLGYALQWFGLALACGAVYLFALLKTREEKDGS